MSTGLKKTWIQCNECGAIYQIPRSVPIDKLYVTSCCPECGYMTGLNLGDKEEDIYLYYDYTKDSRWYE